MKRRLGITLRNSPAQGYQENRDAIARQWYGFLAAMAWKHNWVLLPNLGDESASYAHAQGIEGLILTGGDDPGLDVQRDQSELALLNYCKEKQLPVLGICRGLQLLHIFEGGQLQPLDAALHVATRHEIERTESLPWNTDLPLMIEVNSYHRQGLANPLATGWQALAWTQHSLEAIIEPQKHWAGIMWHPEREPCCQPFDRQLFQWLFD